LQVNNNLQVTSSNINTTTLTPTSHDFTWQTWTFGGNNGSCHLSDVAIIDENDIWAVGAIYLNDSLGNPDMNAYNAVHWNGQKWELKRIYYYGACSAVDYPPLEAIWAFSKTNIVITNGGSIGWFDGQQVRLDCGVNPLLTGVIGKIWAAFINDLYVAGIGGNIAHYNGTNWQKIESGTQSPINDIWGVNDTLRNIYKVFLPVSFVFEPGDHKILTIDRNRKN